jgi:hypothetical protein
MSSRWTGIRDVGKWATPNVTVKSLMVMDSSGVVRQFKPGDNLPQCIIDAIGNVSGGNGGGAAQTLSVTYTSGMVSQMLSISGGNTVAIRTPLKTTALTPANTSVGAVSTRVYGNANGTLGRPDAWIQIDGTNLVLPAFAGL